MTEKWVLTCLKCLNDFKTRQKTGHSVDSEFLFSGLDTDWLQWEWCNTLREPEILHWWNPGRSLEILHLYQVDLPGCLRSDWNHTGRTPPDRHDPFHDLTTSPTRLQTLDLFSSSCRTSSNNLKRNQADSAAFLWWMDDDCLCCASGFRGGNAGSRNRVDTVVALDQVFTVSNNLSLITVWKLRSGICLSE